MKFPPRIYQISTYERLVICGEHVKPENEAISQINWTLLCSVPHKNETITQISPIMNLSNVQINAENSRPQQRRRWLRKIYLTFGSKQFLGFLGLRLVSDMYSVLKLFLSFFALFSLVSLPWVSGNKTRVIPAASWLDKQKEKEIYEWKISADKFHFMSPVLPQQHTPNTD